jgi:hypothetical protein
MNRDERFVRKMWRQTIIPFCIFAALALVVACYQLLMTLVDPASVDRDLLQFSVLVLLFSPVFYLFLRLTYRLVRRAVDHKASRS